jgi:di/tricarboxylate transporter
MWQQVVAVVVTVGIFVLIQIRRSLPLDLVFLTGLLIVSLCGILTPEDAISGFANPAVITIGALFALAAGLRRCGVLDLIGEKLLGNVKTEFGALWRLALVLITSSAFLLNTALVAMLAPVVSHWCRRNNISPSRLLIPVSYLTILGGVCTLIGTSTTLVVNARLQQSYHEASADLAELQKNSDGTNETKRQIAIAQDRKHSLRPLGLLELSVAGLPIALVGGVFMLFLGPKLLPKRGVNAEKLDELRREYLVEMEVRPGCPLVGKAVKNTQLRKLEGLFLIEINREGQLITPVTPTEIIAVDDRLVFSGVVEKIVELETIPGLASPIEKEYTFDPGVNRVLTEAVLSPSSPVMRTRVRDANFRERYNAAILAVHRNGELLPNKIGDIRLQAGDTLLLQTTSEFADIYCNSRDFYLVSTFGEAPAKTSNRKMPLAAAIFGALLIWLIVASFFQQTEQSWTSPAVASLVAVALFVFTRCMRMSHVRAAIDVQLLLTIACALGLGLALDKSGAAASIAGGIVEQIHSPYLLLIAVYVMTMLMTEMITNNAVAALMLPIAVNVAILGEHDPRPFIIAVALAASLAFMTPIGYQTNLMVMGPGGYRPFDFFKIGFPLSMVVAASAIVLIPIFWPF